MPTKTYLRLLQGGLIASLLITFFIFTDLLFPFITSKQLPFNILMEFLLVFWLVFIWRYPEYRPKRNFLSYGLIAYFIAVLASLAVSVDKNLSFWGDTERMLGIFHLFHFLIFYYILITVFRTWREWRTLFLSSIVIATGVSLFGLFGPNIYSTIGNTTYVSGYLIFNLYFCILLFFRSQNAWRWLYTIPVIIMLFEFQACHTSGAIIGLFLSVLLLFLLLGLFHKAKTIRRSALIIFILAVIVVAGIFSQYRAAWFQNSFLRNLTAQKSTFQTRLISWRGAATDFKNHWLFGTGFGNYAIIFDKQFDPKFFNYSLTETYFDRAHNNLIDIASTTGSVGLLTYLSIFVAAFYYLFQEFKKNGRRVGHDILGQKNLEIVILTALIAAYFIQNLAVFDSFVTYIGLMIMLGFIYWLVKIERPEMTEADNEEKIIEPKPILKTITQELSVLAVLLIVACFFASQYNIRTWHMLQRVIQAYVQTMSGDLAGGIDSYRQAFDLNSPLDGDGRVTLINLATSNPNAFNALDPAVAQADLDYIISLAQGNVAHNPQDSLMQMQLAQILDITARYNYRNLSLFNYYSRQAVEAIEASIEASPRRIPVYLSKAQILLGRGEKDEAIAVINYAISLNPDYYEGYCRLAQTYILFKEENKLVGILDKCVDLGGSNQINTEKFLKVAISYYTTKKDYQRAILLSERLAEIYYQDPEAWLTLTKLYITNGEQSKAAAAMQQALALNPDWAKQFQEILKPTSSTATSTPAKKK